MLLPFITGESFPFLSSDLPLGSFAYVVEIDLIIPVRVINPDDIIAVYHGVAMIGLSLVICFFFPVVRS